MSTKINKMKVIPATLIALSAISASVLAQADDQPQTAADSQAQIGATLSATGDSIQQLLDKMSAQKPHDDFQHADYLAKSAANQAKVQAAFNNFKQVLATSILPKLESYMADYNSIATSTNYSDTQKTVLLSGIHTQLSNLVPALQNQYQQELLKLYSSAGVTLISSASDWVSNTYASCGETKDHQILFPDQTNEDTFLFDRTADFQSLVFPALADGCLSQSCISLSAVDQMLLYSLIKDEFERTLNFKFADGTAITLSANTENVQSCNDSNFNGWSALVDTAVDYIGRADFYPASVAQLPFDATTADVQAAARNPKKNTAAPTQSSSQPQAAQATREQTLKDLEAAIAQSNTQRGSYGFSNSLDLIIKFCNQETERKECLSGSEQSDLMKSIDAERNSDGTQLIGVAKFEKSVKFVVSKESSLNFFVNGNLDVQVVK
jgi:hypothetical protein